MRSSEPGKLFKVLIILVGHHECFTELWKQERSLVMITHDVGYTFDVYSRGCDDDRHLGRWRVDSKTREVFVLRKSGKYGRP